MQENNKNDFKLDETKNKYFQEEKDSPIRGSKTNISNDSLREKLNLNMNNSDSFQIYNSYQEEDLNNDINCNQEQIKNKIFSSVNHNIENKNGALNVEIEEEEDLGIFYEQEQMRMEKALKINSSQSNFKNKSKEKIKTEQIKTSKNSFNNLDSNNINKNSIISSNYNNNNFNTTTTYATSNNNNVKNLKNIITNSSNNFKDLKDIKLNSTKNEKTNLIDNRYITNNTDVTKRNVNASKNDNLRTSFSKNFPQKKIEVNKSSMKSDINRSYVKNTAERNTSNKTNKTLEKNKNLYNSNIIENSNKPKVNISLAKVNNSTIINNNKISYEAYKSSFSGNLNAKENSNIPYKRGLKNSESLSNLRTARKISLDKNRLESVNKQNPLKISEYKDFTSNKNNIHNVIKLKISNNKVEELITSNEKSNSRDKNNNSNYTSIFDKKKKLEKNNSKNTKISVSNNKITNNHNNSGLFNKPTNFLTIQESDNYVNKLVVGSTFRKNTANLKINTNNNANLNANIIDNHYSNRNIGNYKTLMTPGIHSVKSDKVPIKISTGINNISSANDILTKISKIDPKNNETDKSDFNNDLTNYLKMEKENNSYTYLLHKKKNAQKDSKALIKKINSHPEIRKAESLKKLNNSVDAEVSSGKINKINISSNKPAIDNTRKFKKIY
jgi:hypothetical protein